MSAVAKKPIKKSVKTVRSLDKLLAEENQKKAVDTTKSPRVMPVSIDSIRGHIRVRQKPKMSPTTEVRFSNASSPVRATLRSSVVGAPPR